MPRYVKLDKIEPLPTDGVLDDITKSLQDWVWEAYKKGIKEQIVANTILIDKHFAKTNRIIVGDLDIPPMICGLEIKVTEELPEGYSFALVEAVETERDRIIKDTKEKVAREIFENIENLLKIVKVPCINAEGIITPLTAGYWFIDPNDYAELKKIYTK